MRRPDGVTAWCQEHLGAPPVDLLWETGHLSWVGALRLSDGRDVVVKVRPDSPRLAGCQQVHESLWHNGFPCPQPLVGPTPLGDAAASAEVHLPGGRPGSADDADLARRTATWLHRLVTLAPGVDDVSSLDPPPAWTGWSDARARPWPPPDEGAELCADAATEPLRPLAFALAGRLRATSLPAVVGHADWYQGNLRWADDRLVSADDWDSVAALPEAAVAGCAAASFRPAPEGVLIEAGADVADTAEFLDYYASARGRPWSGEELEVAWAAGLWQRVFDAAKALVADRPSDADVQLRDAAGRQARAGC